MFESPLGALRDFYRAQGRYAECVDNTLWVGETSLSLMAVPGVLPVEKDTTEIACMLKSSGRIAAVFSPVQSTGVNVSAFVIRDRNYGWHSLQPQFRQQARAALRAGEVRRIEWRELVRPGVAPYVESLQRRGQSISWERGSYRWSAICESAAMVSGLEAWGMVTVTGELAAVMLVWSNGTMSHGLQMYRTEVHKSLRPTHALYFEVARQQMLRPEIEAFSVGRQAIPAMSGVDRFKAHAGFQRETCPVAVVLRPELGWLLGHPKFVHLLRRWQSRSWPGTRLLRNLEVLEVAAKTIMKPGG